VDGIVVIKSRNFLEWLKTVDPKAWSQQDRLPTVLRTGAFHLVFQPLFDLDTRKPFAYEALVRSTAPDFEGPPSLFSNAIRSRVCGALGRFLREMAVEHCSTWPLFLNIHPNEFDEGWLVQPNDPIFVHERPVYLEITESVPLSHFYLCQSVLKEIRGKGVFLAVDDLGAGYSNLKYIADLAPEIVKLDRSLITSLPKDHRLQRLVASVVRLCVDLGAKVVAEGLEEREQVEAVIDAGVHYGQGYFLARPAFPLPKLSQHANWR
jgi:EAL domain-containing protein (putative c-di-GMP-specific phosphodiesterase class I)